MKGEGLRVRRFHVHLARYVASPGGLRREREDVVIEPSTDPGAAVRGIDHDAVHVEVIDPSRLEITIVLTRVGTAGIHRDDESDEPGGVVFDCRTHSR